MFSSQNVCLGDLSSFYFCFGAHYKIVFKEDPMRGPNPEAFPMFVVVVQWLNWV